MARAGGQKPEPFDVGLGTQIEPDLVEVYAGKGGLFGVTVTVLTAVEPEITATAGSPGHHSRDFVGHAYPGHDHYYTARDGVDAATVWAVQGSGTVGTAQPPTESITVGGAHRSLGPAQQVIVHCTSVRPCGYYFDGRFKSKK